jgi:hypothetical protein
MLNGRVGASANRRELAILHLHPASDFRGQIRSNVLLNSLD